MSEEMMQTSPFECPAWFDGKKINETVFCEEFLRDYPMVTVNDAFFTVNGRVHDENRLKKVIYDRIKYYVTSGVAKKVTNLLDVMRMECCTAKLSLYQDRIHVANGTYYLNGTFSPEKDFCRNRLPVAYNPDAPQPVTWLHFLSQLLEPEDILTLQEFMGYEVSSKDLYAVYKLWCDDNALSSLSQKSFCSFLKQNESRYNIEYTNKVNIGGGRYARGFVGIELLQRPFL